METNINDKQFLSRITSIVPTELQINFQNLGYYNFIHFGLNTFTKKEWGSGKENPNVFTLKSINTDKWAKDLKATGSKGIIFTAKHHDGFCLYPSKYTDYSIKNTVYKDGKGDLVLDLSKSCKKHGLLFGIYLSPWDRHEKTYGTEKYDEFFINQLEELCTNYGDIFCFWFDGACGEGKNGKKQEYQWERYFETIRKLQPNAIISNCGPDIRWIGNEKGIARESEFAVVPKELTNQKVVAINSQTKSGATTMLNQKISECDACLGCREQLLNQDLWWKPSEMDISITKMGWFYRKSFELFHTRSVANLVKCYNNSVGNNATLLLNIPPNSKGEIPDKFIKQILKAKKVVENQFANEINCKIENTDVNTYTLSFKKTAISSVVLKEDVKKSQRIENFSITANDKVIFTGQTIGFKKFCLFNEITTDKLTLKVLKSRDTPIFKEIKVYGKNI